MEAKAGRIGLRITLPRIIGMGLAVVGVLLLLTAWASQSDMDEIGETNDPLLQQKVDRLEDQRNVALVSGVGFLFMGFFALAMLGEPGTSTIAPQSEMISAAKMAADTATGLSLAGNSSLIPAKHGLTKERLFVAAPKNGFLAPSALTDDMVFSPGKDGSTPGVLVEPFGLSLLNHIEQELGTRLDGVGIEAAEGTLQILKHGFGMMRDFHFKERDGKTMLRVEYKALLEACRTVRKERPDTCRQIQCVGCSCLLTAASRATEKIVSVIDVDNSSDSVVFTLDMKSW